jgi:hypothetical protein
VEGKPPSSKSKVKANVVRDFTLQVEWEGGGVEELRNPEWRMKVDAPDKQGKISHRDTKVSKSSGLIHIICANNNVDQF